MQADREARRGEGTTAANGAIDTRCPRQAGCQVSVLSVAGGTTEADGLTRNESGTVSRSGDGYRGCSVAGIDGDVDLI